MDTKLVELPGFFWVKVVHGGAQQSAASSGATIMAPKRPPSLAFVRADPEASTQGGQTRLEVSDLCKSDDAAKEWKRMHGDWFKGAHACLVKVDAGLPI